MKRIISLIVALTMILALCLTANAMELTTTSANVEAEWVTKGWNRIHKDELFAGDKELTRGEFLALINSLYEFKDQKDISFKDVIIDSTYYKEVAKAYGAGYIVGNGNGTFAPEREITNLEVYIMITRILKLDTNVQPEKMHNYKDANEVPSWAHSNVEAYVQKGFLDGKNKIKPFETIMGADAVVLLENVKALNEVKEEVKTEETATEEPKGNGKSPLNLLGAYFVKIEGSSSVELGKLEDGITSDEVIIKLSFDRGVVRDNWENNKAQIKLQSNKGEEISSEVFRIEGNDAEKENIYINLTESVKSGKTVNVVIGSELKANNGNTLGQELKLSFEIK